MAVELDAGEGRLKLKRVQVSAGRKEKLGLNYY